VAHKDELNELDAAIGDADHGTNLSRGLQKVVAELQERKPATVQDTCKITAMTILSTVGGTSGALWGSGWLKAAQVLPPESHVDDAVFLEALQVFVKSIEERGKAVLGDKTMLDVFIPAVDQLGLNMQDQRSLGAAAAAVAPQVKEWAEATVLLQAKRGRANYLGPRSIGHMDPGVRSSVLWWECLHEISGGLP
jgi:dihydroxyacetone kinase-like protein